MADFVLAESGGEVSILADGVWSVAHPIDPDSVSARQAVAVDVNHVAFMAGRTLAVVSRDGEVRSATIDSTCSSLVSDQTRIAVLCDEGRQGRAPTIRVFSLEAQATASVPVHRHQERSSTGDDSFGDSPSVSLVAAGPSFLWLEYADRFGFARGGSRLVAKHRWDGSLVTTARIDGAIYASELSSDGRYAAFLAGGSSGACHTVANLRVLDLVSMTVVDTAPDTPGGAAATMLEPGDVYFNGTSLRWQGTVIHAVGFTPHDNGGDCEESPPYWRRSLDVNTRQLVDTQLPADPGTRVFIGPDCTDVSSPTSDFAEKLGERALIYSPPYPDRCEVR